MATKKVIYFIAGNSPTETEQGDLAWLNARTLPEYQVTVMNALHDATYDDNLQAADLCACAQGGSIPSAYSAINVLVPGTDADQGVLKIGPSALSFVHTGTSQMTAFLFGADGSVTDVTAASGMAWTSATGATATIGSGTGKLTGVAAGTTVITATLTYDTDKTVTATETVTCS